MNKLIENTHQFLSKKIFKWNPGINSIWSPKWICVVLMYILAMAFMAQDPWFGDEFFSWNQGVIVLLLSFIVITTLCFEWNLMGKAEGINVVLQFLLISPFALFLGRIIGKPYNYSNTGIVGESVGFIKGLITSGGILSFIPRPIQEIFASPGLVIFLVFICIALSFGKRKSTRIGLLVTALIVPLFSTLAYQPQPSLNFILGVLFLIVGISMQFLDVNSYVSDFNIVSRLKNVYDEAERKCSIRIAKRAVEDGRVSEKTVLEAVRRCYSNQLNLEIEKISSIAHTISHRMIHEHGLLNVNISAEGIFLIPASNIFAYDSLWAEVALWPRGIILGVIAIIWWLSPLDIIPDAIPFFGTVDDFIILFVGGAPLMKQLSSMNTSRTKGYKNELA